MNDKPVRVRIAPSPSGYLHVGTGRMAIANYLFARHYGGRFLVRIEDTDKERSKPELIEPILEAFRWLGVDWDEEIVYQSEREDVYREYARKMLDTGHAYRDFATKVEIGAEREKARAEKRAAKYDNLLSEDEVKRRAESDHPYATRMKIPEGETTYDDMVSGSITRQNSEIEDLIIARSDGTATYNLAVVVDDHEMGITHIIRGNDHVSNTFKQIHIYQALGFEVPQFGHVPLILRPDKRKVSKRLGDKDIAAYKDDGILPEAMFNFLCLLGWNPKIEREIFTGDELIEIFTEKNFNTANAVFNEEKLIAFNKEHIALKSDHDLATLVAPLLVEAGLTSKYWLETRWEYLRTVVELLKGRASRLSDFVERGAYFFSFDYTYEEKAEKKQFKPEAADLLDDLAGRFEALTDFNHDAAESVLGAMAEEKGLKKGQLIHPTRLAVSGSSVGPGLYDLLVTLSQPVVVERMRKATEYIRAMPAS